MVYILVVVMLLLAAATCFAGYYRGLAKAFCAMVDVIEDLCDELKDMDDGVKSINDKMSKTESRPLPNYEPRFRFPDYYSMTKKEDNADGDEVRCAGCEGCGDCDGSCEEKN